MIDAFHPDFWSFEVTSAQRARAHGEAMMKRCREAKMTWNWRVFFREKGTKKKGARYLWGVSIVMEVSKMVYK